MSEENTLFILPDEIYNELVGAGALRINRLAPGMDKTGDGLAERVSNEMYCLFGTKPLSHKLYVNSINRNYYLCLSVESLGRSQGHIMSCLKDWFRSLRIGEERYYGTEVVPVSVKTFGEAANISLELSLPLAVQDANILKYVTRSSRQFIAEMAHLNDSYRDIDYI